jgi:hypothetical protein
MDCLTDPRKADLLVGILVFYVICNYVIYLYIYATERCREDMGTDRRM